MTTLYKYVCETGCGRETYTTKKWKIRPCCSSCGERSGMQYKGEFNAILTEKRRLFANDNE